MCHVRVAFSYKIYNNNTRPGKFDEGHQKRDGCWRACLYNILLFYAACSVDATVYYNAIAMFFTQTLETAASHVTLKYYSGNENEKKNTQRER